MCLSWGVVCCFVCAVRFRVRVVWRGMGLSCVSRFVSVSLCVIEVLLVLCECVCVCVGCVWLYCVVCCVLLCSVCVVVCVGLVA